MFNNFFRNGCLWGLVRLFVVILILLLFIQFGRLIFEQIDTGAVVAEWEDNDSLLQTLPGVLQRFFAFVFSGVFIRYFYFPLAGFIGAILLLARYVQETYKLPQFRLGLRHVLVLLFGMGYPSLKIVDGRKKLEPEEINLLNLKGGPGIVQASEGSVFLVENLNMPDRVRSVGSHFVSQAEMIKDVNSLEDQHGFVESVPATTKDGIPIQVRDIHFRYRVFSESIPNEDQPYPYTDQAVRDIAYNRIVTAEKKLSPWQFTVQLAVQSAITDYVAGHRIDDLTTAPVINDPNPRVKIRNRLFSESSKVRFNRLGTELLWVDIGHFDIMMKDERDPRPKKWGKKWEGVSRTERALGEGEKLYYQEIGRAEAQSEILRSILNSLKEASIADNPRRNLQKIILMRTAQVLEAMTEKESKPEIPAKTRRPVKRPRRRRRG